MEALCPQNQPIIEEKLMRPWHALRATMFQRYQERIHMYPIVSYWSYCAPMFRCGHASLLVWIEGLQCSACSATFQQAALLITSLPGLERLSVLEGAAAYLAKGFPKSFQSLSRLNLKGLRLWENTTWGTCVWAVLSAGTRTIRRGHASTPQSIRTWFRSAAVLGRRPPWPLASCQSQNSTNYEISTGDTSAMWILRSSLIITDDAPLFDNFLVYNTACEAVFGLCPAPLNSEYIGDFCTAWHLPVSDSRNLGNSLVCRMWPGSSRFMSALENIWKPHKILKQDIDRHQIIESYHKTSMQRGNHGRSQEHQVACQHPTSVASPQVSIGVQCVTFVYTY